MCLTYLLFDTFASAPPADNDSYNAMVKLFPLQHYAAQSWDIHVHRLDHHETPASLMRLVLDLLSKPINLERSAQAFNTSSTGRNLIDGQSQRYPRKMTPIHWGAYFGLNLIIERVLGWGENINDRVEDGRLKGWSAIHFMALNVMGDTCGSWMTDFLAEKGIDLNAKEADMGKTAMHKAAEEGLFETLKALTWNSADMEILDVKGRRPLHLSVLSNAEETTICLIEAGCEISPQTSELLTPLYIAAEAGKYSNAYALLGHGADVTIQDQGLKTALHKAATWTYTRGRPVA